MTNLVGCIGKEIPSECIVKGCKRNGCSVSLQGMSPRRLIINMDCQQLGISNRQENCDYIVVGAFSETDWIVPLELKRGNVEADKVRGQLQEGARFAERKILISDQRVQFRPAVVFKGKIHRSQTQKLKTKKYNVKFQDEYFEIKTVRSGKKLVEELS